ncbi:HNH endonuclease signature motif containing protein [Mycetocola miduiensis]|uniref:HNH endonuclease n=1 Tax=Mycetocola miduiensis TaxID=995034 RepID=A0A1I5DSS1_9MICO|nr:HNH endonuclease signature motif containing protein [Mycetocola miduiensis]SFO02283.1 HNH endonuclease [Mycetocola miduiensis]
MNIPPTKARPAKTPLESGARESGARESGARGSASGVGVAGAGSPGLLGSLSGEELLQLASDAARALRRCEATLAEVANEIAVRSDPARGSAGLAARHGHHRASQLIEQVSGVSARTASRLIRVGGRVFDRATDTGLPLPPLFPIVGEAFRAGLLGIDTADTISTELGKAAPRAKVDALTVAEATLVGEATGATHPGGAPLSADLVAVQARVWRDALDEDGIEPRAKAAFEQRELWVSRHPENGLIGFGGKVTIDVGAKLLALLDAILSPRTAPRFLSNQERAEQEEAERELTKDRRTPGQQRADVFAAMIDSLARSTDAPTVTGAAPTVVVTVTADVLQKKTGTGTIVGIQDPVPYSTIRQILCDASTVPAFLDPDGALVALGTENRTFNRLQRLGMIARDGPTCAVKDCTIPATATEAHHIQEWSDGGQTDVINGILLCWYHHRMLDFGEWTITVDNGKPRVVPPDWLQR